MLPPVPLPLISSYSPISLYCNNRCALLIPSKPETRPFTICLLLHSPPCDSCHSSCYMIVLPPLFAPGTPSLPPCTSYSAHLKPYSSRTSPLYGPSIPLCSRTPRAPHPPPTPTYPHTPPCKLIALAEGGTSYKHVDIYPDNSWRAFLSLISRLSLTWASLRQPWPDLRTTLPD